MKNFSDKIITGFFVFVFAILWFFSTKYYVKPKKYQIVIYDVYGKESIPNGVRTQFQTQGVARNFIKEYQEIFPHLNFSMKQFFPEIKRRVIFRKILSKNYK